MDFIVSIVVCFVFATALVVTEGSFEAWEKKFLRLSFAAHLVATGAQIVITTYFYGGGDMFLYANNGARIATLLETNPSHTWPEVWLLLTHGPARLPIHLLLAGTSTGAMQGIAGVLLWATAGSLFAACATLSFLAFFGQVYLYRAFRESLPREHWRNAAIGVLLLPSVCYWGATFAKETAALVGMGPVVYGIVQIFDRKWLRGLVLCSIGGGIVLFTKPYILAALAISTAALFLGRSLRSGTNFAARPIYLIAGGISAFLIFAVVTTQLPQFQLETVAEKIANTQTNFSKISAGTNVDVGNAGARTLTAQIAFAPVALFNALFRPVVFEARNVVVFASSLETTWLSFLFVASLRGSGIRPWFRALTNFPFLLFGAVFMVLFGTAVGLASGNLGSLFRYRVPMMPFWATILLVQYQLRKEQASQAEASNQVQPRVLRSVPAPRFSR